MDLTVAATFKVALLVEVLLKITSSEALGTASLPQLLAVFQFASPPPPSHTTDEVQLVFAAGREQFVQVPAETEAVLSPRLA